MMYRISLLVLSLTFAFVDSGDDNLTSSALNFDGTTNASTSLRDKRETDFRLDQSEIERQNKITQQIFANYVERRLFPNRSTSQRIPTIDEILPKTTPATPLRQKPRGFAATAEKRKNFRTKGPTAAPNGGRNHHKNFQRKNHHSPTVDVRLQQQQVVVDDEPEDVYAVNIQQKFPDDEVDSDGQESLQSVESEQHDQYYAEVFNTDPSENEIDSVIYVPPAKLHPQTHHGFKAPFGYADKKTI